jgi:CheY-like chemotaxis protein
MNKTILLADDSATIRRIVELAFTDTDFRVEAVASGAEALPLIETLRPDIVLADVVMPEPTGYELCRTIKSSPQPVPVLLLTGTFEPFDGELARECGADGHLVKPFESVVLLERVEQLLTPPEPVEEEVISEIEAVSDASEPAADEVVEIPVDLDTPDAGRAIEVRLSPDEIDAIANAVVARLSDQVVREIASRVVPELAAKIVRERIQELESES